VEDEQVKREKAELERLEREKAEKLEREKAAKLKKKKAKVGKVSHPDHRNEDAENDDAGESSASRKRGRSITPPVPGSCFLCSLLTVVRRSQRNIRAAAAEKRRK
jgi:hypothetical protein